MGLQRFSTARYVSKVPDRKETPPKFHTDPKPPLGWKRDLHDARMARDEAVSVAAREPQHSGMAEILADAATAAQDAYNALCAAAGVCRTGGCYRPVVEGNRRCKSHAPFYARRQAQPAKTQL
jgi:hypothetical protein